MNISKNINAEKIQGNLHVNGLSATTINVNNQYDLPSTIGTNGQTLTVNENGGIGWATLSSGSGSGGGNVSNVGTPINDQLAIWTGENTIEGSTQLVYQSSALQVLDGSGSGSYLYNYGRLIMGDSTTKIDIEGKYGNVNHSAILANTGSALVIGIKNLSPMYFDSSGNLSFGHNKSLNTTHSARFELTGGGNNDTTSTFIVRNSDLDVAFQVKDGGTVVIPNVGSTTPVTNLAVDASGNVVSGTTGGSGGSSVSYGTTTQIPFMNSSGTGFEYTNSTVAGYNGRFEWQNEMLEVHSGLGSTVPTASINNLTASDYTARFRKSYIWSQPKTSLGVRRDGTVEIGEWNNIGYQNVISIHYMGSAAITAMQNDEYFSKLYVDVNKDLHFKDWVGTDSVLNIWKQKVDNISRVGIYDTRGILELNYYAANTFGTSSQYRTIVAASGAKIGSEYTNGTDSHTFSTSLIISSGSAKLATKGKVANSILIGSSAEIQEGEHNCVIGYNSKVWQRFQSDGTPITSGVGSDHNTLLGNGINVRGTNLVGIGRAINIFDSVTNGEAFQSVAIGHGLAARSSGQYLFGNSFHTQNAKIPLIAFDVNITTTEDSMNSNRDPGFVMFRGIDSNGDQTQGTSHPEHPSWNRDSGINIIMGSRAGRKETTPGTYAISQYAGEGVFMMSAGANQLYMVEPSGSITSVATFYPYKKRNTVTTSYQWEPHFKTGIKFKSEGTVNTGNIANDAGYHFLGQTLVANGGHHAEEHVDTNIGFIAVGKGTTNTTSSIKSKDKNGGTTFDVRDDGVVVYKSITFGNLPSASNSTGGQIFLTTGGSETNVMIYSNGTNWISMSTGNVIT